jgi:ankyrin repeat protein
MRAAAFIQLIIGGEERAALEALAREPGLASARDAGGVSVVCLAAYRKQPQLLAALASLRQGDLDIFEASCAGELLRVRQLLVEDGTRVRAVSPDGFSPVGYSAFFGHPALLQELLERGGEANAPSQNALRVAPIHGAAAHPDHVLSVQLVRVLLDAGADPNARQAGGYTALHAAAAAGKLALIALLLERGAEREARTDAGERASDLALKRGHVEAVRLIEAPAKSS